MKLAVPAGALLFVAASPALAARPDDLVGLHAFDADDVLDRLDGPAGLVRVTYSVEGPNATILDDDDASGAPDFAEEVAATAEDVLSVFADAGFREPLSEDDAGLGDLGGSGAFDFYLVDFGGAGDGAFAVDGCAGAVCAGHMVMENDFFRYGYPSLSAAIRVLTSHELFHAVQAAYRAELDVWISEGTAVWAEKLYDDDSSDFRAFAARYLEDVGRPLDRPPAGPVPAFAYATALFWEFLSLRHGDGAIVALLEALEDLEGLDAVEVTIEAQEGATLPTLEDEWMRFTEANLLTGDRASDASFYPFAERIDGLVPVASAAGLVEDEERFYPLAASYWFVSLSGPTWFASPDDPTGLFFALHPALARGVASPVGAAVATWRPVAGEAIRVADLAPGDYWLRGTYPLRADQSVRIAFCVGGENDVAACAPEPTPDAGPEDAAPPADAAVDGGDDASRRGQGGCSCRIGAGPAEGTLHLCALLGAALAFWRRRRRP